MKTLQQFKYSCQVVTSYPQVFPNLRQQRLTQLADSLSTDCHKTLVSVWDELYTQANVCDNFSLPHNNWPDLKISSKYI